MDRRWYLAFISSLSIPTLFAGPSSAAESTHLTCSADDHDQPTQAEKGGPPKDPDEPTVTFLSCRRVAVTGRFEDGDTISANTGFFDDAGFGNTIGEFFVTVGEDVTAPLVGTITFQIDSQEQVTETDQGAFATGFDFGDTGSVITGVAGPDAIAPSPDFPNPQAEVCIEAIRPADIEPLE